MKDATSTIVEYVQLLVEKKIREADISDGQKAKWGSRKHVSDLKRRLKEAEYWRDKQKKGSEKRAHYRNVVNDIKRQLSAATKDSKKSDLEEAANVVSQLSELLLEKKDLVAKNYSNPNEKRPGIVISTEKFDWTQWPSTPVSFDYKIPGTGRGEATLAWLMNGSIMGQNIPWDLQGASDGTYVTEPKEKWEVKEPDDFIVRLGGPSSAKAVADVLFEMTGVVKKVNYFFKDDSEDMMNIKRSMDEKDKELLKSFNEEDSDQFKTGNVTKSRYNLLLRCIDIIKKSLNSEFSVSPNEKPGNKYVEFGDRDNSTTIKKDVTIKLYKRLGALAGIPDEELKVTPQERIAQNFDHEAFTDTSAWRKKTDLWESNDLFKSVVSTSMQGLTGMIFVDSSGYCAIPTAHVASALKFESVSSNRIKFRVAIGKPKAATS